MGNISLCKWQKYGDKEIASKTSMQEIDKAVYIVGSALQNE